MSTGKDIGLNTEEMKKSLAELSSARDEKYLELGELNGQIKKLVLEALNAGVQVHIDIPEFLFRDGEEVLRFDILKEFGLVSFSKDWGRPESEKMKLIQLHVKNVPRTDFKIDVRFE